MAIELIQIKDGNFPKTSTIDGSGLEYIVVSKADGITYAMLTSDFKAFLGTVQTIAPKAIAPSDPSPTLDGLYLPTIDGTYANAGGLVRDTGTGGVDEGLEVQFIKNGTEWVKNTYPLPIQKADGIVESGNTNAVSGGEVFDKTIRLVTGKNLFNPANVREGFLVTTGGTVVPLEDWACSDYIAVTEGAYYLSSDKSRVGVGLFDAQKQNVRYLSINTGVINVQEGEVFIVFNLKSPPLPNWTWAQLERNNVPTAYEPYFKVVPESSVEGLVLLSQQVAENSQRLDVFEIVTNSGDNLLDPSKATLKALLSSGNGGVITNSGVSDGYDTSDFIAVKPSTQYTANRSDGTGTAARIVCFYSSDRVFISGIDGDTTQFTTPENAAFVRISTPNQDRFNGLPIDNFGVFEGVAVPFIPFAQEILVTIKGSQPAQKPDNAVATMADLRGGAGAPLSYTYSDDGILVLSNENDRLTIIAGADREFNGNNMLNFASYDMAGLSKSNGDDVAPMHIEGTTLGANHGRPHSVATISAHGLNDTAIGQAWVHSNGKTYYPVRIVDVNRVGFLSENEGTLETPVFNAMPVGTVTRGGITLTVSAIASAQLYPSIKNLSLEIYTSTGIQLTGAGVGGADYIKVVEAYDIMATASILDKLKLREGQNEPPVYDGDASVKVENVYIFNADLSVVVLNTFEPIIPVAFADIMVTQAISLGTGAQYYVPNSNPLNGSVDLRKPSVVDWSASIPSTYVTNSNQPQPLDPPNRVAQYLGNTGFLIGYIPDAGVGLDLNTYTARTFELRNNTGKVYPHPLEAARVGAFAPVGEAYYTAMYRAYCDLSKVRTAERLSYFIVDYNGSAYVFVDYSASVLDRLQLDRDDLVGRQVQVIQEVNTEILTEVYTGSIRINAVYVEGETCFAVLKIG